MILFFVSSISRYSSSRVTTRLPPNDGRRLKLGVELFHVSMGTGLWQERTSRCFIVYSSPHSHTARPSSLYPHFCIRALHHPVPVQRRFRLDLADSRSTVGDSVTIFLHVHVNRCLSSLYCVLPVQLDVAVPTLPWSSTTLPGSSLQDIVGQLPVCRFTCPNNFSYLLL